MICKAEDCDNPARPWPGRGPQPLYCSKVCVQRQNHRNQDRRNRYSIHGATLDDYDRLLMEQEGRCAICGTDSPGGNNTRFAFDHDHASNRSRGLLCYLCNVGLGSFMDDRIRLQRAIDYLAAHAPAQRGIHTPPGLAPQGINTPC
ncbi:endonuclease VII domain-containing protein [Streptomyces ossamyceticus]|uniref:endonuclease VII domain-containing protein n=1 Tax=Streptomyces ossamyceticus TaxID=249581 RepID=UPI0036E4B413